MGISKAESPWKKLGETLVQRTKIFDLYSQRMRFPDGKTEADFYFVKGPNWTNVVPITTNRELVVVRQFRHGIQEYCYETPGGLVDPGEVDMSAAAQRELEEETGYVPGRFLPLLPLHPNPTMMTNRCFFYLALESEKKKELNLEPSEDITVHLFPLKDLAQMIRNGEFKHSLFYAALLLALVQYPGELKEFWE